MLSASPGTVELCTLHKPSAGQQLALAACGTAADPARAALLHPAGQRILPAQQAGAELAACTTAPSHRKQRGRLGSGSRLNCSLIFQTWRRHPAHHPAAQLGSGTAPPQCPTAPPARPAAASMPWALHQQHQQQRPHSTARLAVSISSVHLGFCFIKCFCLLRRRALRRVPSDLHQDGQDHRAALGAR